MRQQTKNSYLQYQDLLQGAKYFARSFERSNMLLLHVVILAGLVKKKVLMAGTDTKSSLPINIFITFELIFFKYIG